MIHLVFQCQTLQLKCTIDGHKNMTTLGFAEKVFWRGSEVRSRDVSRQKGYSRIRKSIL